MIQPRNDRVLIERLDEPQTGVIIRPEVASTKGIKGVVLSVGPGKWVPGEWWKIKGKWEWIEGYRQELQVKPGMKVLFNSRWHDLDANYEKSGYEQDGKLHLVQEADIYGILNAN